VDVLNAVLRKVTIMRVDKEGGDATEGISQARANPSRITVSNKTAKSIFESLFHRSIRPNYYGNHAALSPGFVQHRLA
jgi:hypothetical protein